MPVKGSNKYLSIKQEDDISDMYGGVRSLSSGGADNDQGDVRTDHYLIECKMKGSPSHPLKRVPTIVQRFETITREAYSEGRVPILALRYYLPDHYLANPRGWVDLSVKLTGDDATL